MGRQVFEVARFGEPNGAWYPVWVPCYIIQEHFRPDWRETSHGIASCRLCEISNHYT